MAEAAQSADYGAVPEVIGQVDQHGEITIGGLLHRRGWLVQIVPATPCKWCNDEGIVHTHDGQIIGPCECSR